MDFQHIVEEEPEPEKVDAGPGRDARDSPSALSDADYATLRKRLRFDTPLMREALCLSAIVAIGAGVFHWVGVGPALAAVGAAILYAQGTRLK